MPEQVVKFDSSLLHNFKFNLITCTRQQRNSGLALVSQNFISQCQLINKYSLANCVLTPGISQVGVGSGALCQPGLRVWLPGLAGAQPAE